MKEFKLKVNSRLVDPHAFITWLGIDSQASFVTSSDLSAHPLEVRMVGVTQEQLEKDVEMIRSKGVDVEIVE